jgi:predicted O-methyltransferase YrrM
MIFARISMAPQFSQDFTTRQIEVWEKTLARFAGQPNIHAIEVGCFEGRTTLWLLENVLTHSFSTVTCIDPYCPPAFQTNLEGHFDQVCWVQARSGVALRDSGLERDAYHFAYIDGGHTAAEVLEDAVLVFPLLTSRGILIFDDYYWPSSTPEFPHTMPKIAIDAFLAAFCDKINVLHMGYQVIVEKL